LEAQVQLLTAKLAGLLGQLIIRFRANV